MQGEHQGEDNNIWKRIWALNLPGKVIHFLWRVCRGCLPTNHALVQKYVNIDVGCPWCHESVKNDVHVLFLCDFAKTIWMTAGLNEFIQRSLNDTALRVIKNVFARCPKEQCV